MIFNNCIFFLILFFSNIIIATKVIENIEATVSGDPILLSELENRFNREKGKSKDQILQSLIEDKALQKHCNAIGIFIKDEDVEIYISNIIKQNGSKSLFLHHLQKAGFTYNEYKKHIISELYKMRLVQQKIKNQVIEEKNLIQKLLNEEDSLIIEQILFSTTKKDMASDFVKQVNSGAEYIDLVAEYLKRDKTIVVNRMVDVQKKEIENSFAELIFSTKIKNATLPIKSKQGWHVFYIKEKTKKMMNTEGIRREQYEEEIKQALERYIKDILSSFNIEKFL